MGARRCPYTAGTFRALRWADGPIWIVCPTCRRYIELMMTTDVAERSVKRTSFSCSVCGGRGHIASEDPARWGYQLDPRDGARRRGRPAAKPRPAAPLPVAEGPTQSEFASRPVF